MIRQLLPFEEGQEYSEVRTLEAQRNLFSIEMIQRASIIEAVDPAGVVPDDVVPLQVRITEAEAHSVRFGGGWSTLGVWKRGRTLDEPKLLRRSETTPAPEPYVQSGS